MAAKEADTLSQLLKKIARSHGMERRFARGKVWEIWEDAVGEAIANHAWPKGFREGVKLVVAVEDSVWMQQLSLQKNLLLDAINRHLPPDAQIKDIRFVQGNVDKLRKQWTKKKKKSSGSTTSSIRVSPQVKKRAEKLVSSIEDDELKSALKKLYLKSRSQPDVKG